MDSDFFYNYLKLNIDGQDKIIFNSMINLISKKIRNVCKKHIKPPYTIYYNIHDSFVSAENYTSQSCIYKLEFNNDSVELIDLAKEKMQAAQEFQPGSQINPNPMKPQYQPNQIGYAYQQVDERAEA